MISNSDFEKVIDCLPEGFTWGSALTPDIALHIVNAAESSRIAQLESQLTEAKKDQARYQWLLSIDGAKWISLHQLSYAQLDTYIDAAIASKEQGK
jgi:hypothetical protein